MTIPPESEVSRMQSRGAAIAVAALMALGLMLAPAPRAQAQTLTTLYSFCAQGGTACTDGASPVAGLVQGSDSNFYGTTENGGANGGGTIFKVTPRGTLTTLYNFCSQSGCADGSYPAAALVEGSDGNFYGTTNGGGAYGNYGTIFRITPSGALTTLYSFCAQSNCTDGFAPAGALFQGNDGSFYGTTSYGGTNSDPSAGIWGDGTVFKITPSGALTTLYRFCTQSGCPDGQYPYGGLVQGNDGNFYGTTSRGGQDTYGGYPYGYGGTVFVITPSGTLTTLYNFCSEAGCEDGGGPMAALVQATDGNLYGTTVSGGFANRGEVFLMNPSFPGIGMWWFDLMGAAPFAAVLQGVDGLFYGTTKYDYYVYGPSGEGTIFRIPPIGGPTTLYAFCEQGISTCPDGSQPVASLVQGTDGSFYGTTSQGGLYGGGTVFRLALVSGGALSPTSLAFALRVDGSTSRAEYVTLVSTGVLSLSISSITITGANAGDFAEADNCPSILAPGASCTIQVTFTPSTVGLETATVTVSDNNATNRPQAVALTGSGILPVSLTPRSATYSSWKVGTTSAAKTFALFNNLSTTLDNVTISTTGDFAVSATTCGASLAARSHCTISVTFTPTATGIRTGTLTVSDTAGNSPQISQLTGTGK